MKVLALAVLLAAPAHAEAPRFRLTMSEAEAAARAHSPALKAASEDSAGMGDLADERFAALLPRLTLDGSYRYQTEVPNFSVVPGQPARPFGDHRATSIGPTLSWTLWDQGSLYKTWRAQKARAASQEEQRRLVERQASLGARLAYVQVQLAGEQLRELADSLSLAEAQYKEIDNRFKAGAASRIDTLSSHQDTLQRRKSFLQAQSDLGGALRELLQLVGRGEDLDLARPLDARVSTSAPSGLGEATAGKMAVVYAEGEIVDGKGTDHGYVYGDKTARILRRLREDESVKAVVLRINSPGGSVSASETIQREVRLLQASKPVVVSMGTVAASGGYWISNGTERVFAEPTTITGSIGVFGLFMNFQGLATDKLGLTFDTVKTGKFADASTVVRPKTDEELAIFQHLVDWVYEQFLTKVAESRHLDRAVVHEIAQGRVWSGREALKLGLVDELGGLASAIKYAAEKANLGTSPRISEYPQKKQLAEVIQEALEGRHREQAFASGAAGGLVRQALTEWQSLTKFNDPRGLYTRIPFDLSLR